MCQDLIGWKAPVRAHQASTPPKQQRPSDLSMQPDQDMQPANDGDVDSPTATANGPAVQPVSAEKAKKPSKAAAKQAAAGQEGDQGAAAGQEDPEKKAKKVSACSSTCTKQVVNFPACPQESILGVKLR